MKTSDENQIESDLNRIFTVLNSEIFELKHIHHPLRKSAFIELMICLRDLMHKCETYSKKIDFTDDIVLTNDIKDITDLIKFIRDACCHIDSKNHRFEKTKGVFSFNTLYGQSTFGSASSEYSDDICFCFGEHKLYMERHIKRAIDEAIANLKPKMTLLEFDWEIIFKKRNVC